MPTDPGAARHRRIGYGVGLAAGLGYSLVAATTTPFTTGADIVTALPMVVMAALLVARWPRHTLSMQLRPAESGHPYRSWLILVVAVALWELFNYVVHGARADHPTFSSMTTAVNRYYLLKALLFLAWLSLAAMIVRRSSKVAAVTTATSAA
jgi:hypothetical protein